MPVTPADILRRMANDAPQQVEDIEASISQIEEQIDTLNTEIDGVQNGLCGGGAESDLTGYLDGTKLIEIQLLYGNINNVPFSVEYGPDYGTINYLTGGIVDFRILDSSGNIEYEYLGANWDNDPVVQAKIDEYAFGNDYLTKPLDLSGTYGLIPSRDNLVAAKGLLQNNADKVEDSIDIFDEYAS